MLWMLSCAFAGPPVSVVVDREAAPVLESKSKTASVRPLVTGENAFLADLWLESGARVPEHRDATEEYLVFFEGGGTLSIDGNVSQVSAGRVVFMAAGALVRFERRALTSGRISSGGPPARLRY